MRRKPAVRLRELESEIGQIRFQASALLSSTDPEFASRRPRENSWSVVECVEHLNLSADSYFPLWEDAISQARRGRQADEPYRMDFRGRILFWMLEPPPRMRMPTTRPFVPIHTASPAVVLRKFLYRQDRIIDVMRACEGLAIDNIRIVSPFSSRVQYSVWSSLVLTAAHERRHLWQAEQGLATFRVAIPHS
jgi:hypothetical protein